MVEREVDPAKGVEGRKRGMPGCEMRAEGGLRGYLAGGPYFRSSSINSFMRLDAFSAISRASSSVKGSL